MTPIEFYEQVKTLLNQRHGISPEDVGIDLSEAQRWIQVYKQAPLDFVEKVAQKYDLDRLDQWPNKL